MMAVKILLLVLFASHGFLCVNGQIPLVGCLPNWMSHGESCYLFVFDEELSYDDAAASCLSKGSALVSVNDISENTFVVQYLNRHAGLSNSGWYTSGLFFNGAIHWYGDGQYSIYYQSDRTFWIPEVDQIIEENRVIYMTSALTGRYGFTLGYGTRKRSYICESPKNEIYRVLQLHRDFDFGYPPETDITKIPKGPQMMNEETDVVVILDLPLILDCVASGNPPPSYSWAVKDISTDLSQGTYRPIDSGTSRRYTFSDGRFTITNPTDREDAGIYQCVAENNLGSVLSAPVTVSFGYLQEFSPNKQGFIEAKLGKGTFLSCQPPNAKPGLAYAWYKNTIESFVRPELDKYYFISSNGNLYFSETQESYAGDYHCVVTLIPDPGERFSTNQPPSRTSQAIELRVPGNPSTDFGPNIHQDFIGVYPKPPLVKHDVRLECFAYGRMPLTYFWAREGASFPEGTYWMYDNRVMVIPKAIFDAEGNYTCTVIKTSGKQNTASQTFTLNLEAKPYFVYPMKDIHADIGSKITMRCEARAVPRATYTWYKNAKVLQSIPGDVYIRESILEISNLDEERHAGMYQCQASNVHGAVMATAQLRVLSIEPSFEKNPLPDVLQTSQGGNLTIPCRPEAAPQPEIIWSHNGSPIGFGNPRLSVDLDGTLKITDASMSDQGIYTCKAVNINGEAQSFTRVTVMTGIQFLRKPGPTNVRVNQTAFLYCDASYDYNKFDLIYSWRFNGHLIDTKDDPFYREGSNDFNSGLYIINAQYRHSGTYECLAQTVHMTIKAEAFVRVNGPPSAPAGVFVESSAESNRTARVVWTWNPAADHGYPVQYFDIETITEFSTEWTLTRFDIPVQRTVIPDGDMKHFFDVDNLLPYNSYRFRVRAKNDMGVGPPSEPSVRFKVPAAKPVRAPSIINTGGGTVGVLKMEWAPLPRSEEGGPGFGYRVYWKLKTDTQRGFKDKIVGNVTSYYETVGMEYYYLEYLVKVQAYNIKGEGPIGPEAIVYSAEGIPPIVPSNLQCDAVNATAVIVSWVPVPDTRDGVRGKVAGYEVMFVADEDPDVTGGVIVYGQTDHGVIIGLDPNTNYWVRAWVFNGAGPSTLSEEYLCETALLPPGEYPHFVNIYPHGRNSVRVTWRGVMQVAGEASLEGYKVLYWPVGDDIRTANVSSADKVFETVIYGLQADIIYNLRVLAYNGGGDGQKSPTKYFTLLRDGSISVDQTHFDPATSELIIAGASSTSRHLDYLPFLVLVLSKYVLVTW